MWERAKENIQEAEADVCGKVQENIEEAEHDVCGNVLERTLKKRSMTYVGRAREH